MITSFISCAEYFTNMRRPDPQIHMVPSNIHSCPSNNSPCQTLLQPTTNCFSPRSSEMGLISSTEVTRYYLAMVPLSWNLIGSSSGGSLQANTKNHFRVTHWVMAGPICLLLLHKCWLISSFSSLWKKNSGQDNGAGINQAVYPASTAICPI